MQNRVGAVDGKNASQLEQTSSDKSFDCGVRKRLGDITADFTGDKKLKSKVRTVLSSFC